MLAPYRRNRVSRPMFLRQSFVEKKWFIYPLNGIIADLSLHWYNGRWFKQEYIYEWDGQEKEEKWLQQRLPQVYWRMKIAARCAMFGALCYALWIRKPVKSRNQDSYFGTVLGPMCFGTACGMSAVELPYYLYVKWDMKRRDELKQQKESATTGTGGTATLLRDS